MIADGAVLRASQWCYQGIWGVVTRWLLVPNEPPHLTGADDLHVQCFRPAPGYLRYLKFFFWIGLFAIDIGLSLAWIGIFIAAPIVGVLITPFALAVIVLPDVVAYIAIHLRYDSTWYVLSDRTMRIRRGIWDIHETTITYENIQNVSVQQGPVQRYFGIANVRVETAGGGAAGPKGGRDAGHEGILEGIENAEAIRDLIMQKWKATRSAGLGDERFHAPAADGVGSGWKSDHVSVLHQIRQLAAELAQSG